MFVELVVVGIFFDGTLRWLFLTAWEEKNGCQKHRSASKTIGKSEPGFVSRWVKLPARFRPTETHTNI